MKNCILCNGYIFAVNLYISFECMYLYKLDILARNMCKLFSLIPSKKKQRKLKQTKCLLFIFFTVVPKEAIWHLAIWQNWCSGQWIALILCFNLLHYKNYFERGWGISLKTHQAICPNYLSDPHSFRSLAQWLGGGD